MKKLFLFLTLLVFVAGAPVAMAQGTQPKAAKKEAPKINCCVKSDCKQMTKADCKTAKGKIVKDCSKCK